MSKENSRSSPFYWLNMCEGVSERITDLLDLEVHRPGDAVRQVPEDNSRAGPGVVGRPSEGARETAGSARPADGGSIQPQALVVLHVHRFPRPS